LIYLFQEGRSAGLWIKARGYELKDKEKLDHVEAYEKMDEKVDSRDYTPVIKVLQYLHVNNIFLLTNNPERIKALRAYSQVVGSPS
jgi:GTP cyclohydrolase II